MCLSNTSFIYVLSSRRLWMCLSNVINRWVEFFGATVIIDSDHTKSIPSMEWWNTSKQNMESIWINHLRQFQNPLHIRCLFVMVSNACLLKGEEIHVEWRFMALWLPLHNWSLCYYWRLCCCCCHFLVVFKTFINCFTQKNRCVFMWWH